MTSVETPLGEAGVFAGMRPDHLALLARCARDAAFDAGAVILREGDPADTFYVIRQGTVVIETFVPTRGLVPIETVTAGDVVGWSWLFPPYRLHFDARALSLVRASAVDGSCLRHRFEQDPALGYDVLSHLAQVLVERLQATRLRLLDVYGSPDRG
ncbi:MULTISPECIES: cyclic nucleotide-binding domain-containing protein [unclassified Parafrankia]|uniref:cyclic nucleotide-binding domain-containing protein n=1 Tax=unclassified Parafrankia TaxID=2994368 RepID=UPI000DA556E1|nr:MULTISPECIES: cyclic nucleotide-binding domain-containing protein [unclassified Parafrankia]TCJ32665.1 cyclic nucleotide-binding domain-containing protein [Parafrankia sp. BMG5.11]SQD94893.1 Cyclic nucleotide-binding domain (CNMP-BD) protein [Parafrankia sp. Ea1.12]